MSIVAHWKKEKEKEKVTVNPRILKAPKKDLTYIYEVPNFWVFFYKINPGDVNLYSEHD